MDILWMLIVGLVVGALARLFMPGRERGGVFITILLGIAGALLAGILGRSLGLYYADEPAGFVASILGAMLILFVYRLVTRSSPSRRRGP